MTIRIPMCAYCAQFDLSTVDYCKAFRRSAPKKYFEGRSLDCPKFEPRSDIEMPEWLAEQAKQAVQK